MYGLEAISDARGWQMAALGVTIVFMSLIVLALIISQLHNILHLWEKRKTLFQESAAPERTDAHPASAAATLPHPPICPDDILAVAKIWSPLVRDLDEPFSLPALYRQAAENDFPHPHLTINRLREAGILVPLENGLFSWKQA